MCWVSRARTPKFQEMGVLWAERLFELTLYSFETELGGPSESKSIPSIFRHITETFFGEDIISGEKWEIPKATSMLRRALLHFRGAWLPPSVVQAVRGSWALCWIKWSGMEKYATTLKLCSSGYSGSNMSLNRQQRVLKRQFMCENDN